MAVASVAEMTRETLPGGPYLVIVRAGDDEAFRYAQERFAKRDLVEVRRDARAQSRRTTRQMVMPERRRRERRRPMAETWSSLGFVIVPLSDRQRSPRGSAARGLAPSVTHAGAGSAVPLERWPVETPVARALPAMRSAAGVSAVDRSSSAVVALVKADRLVYPSYFAPSIGGWRCGRCEDVLVALGPLGEGPREGTSCPTCRAEVVRVLRWRWQQVNWLAIPGLLLMATIVGLLVPRLLSLVR